MELSLQGAGTIEVSDNAFGRDFNEALVHQVVVSCMANARAGTRAQKNRSAVNGGGAKPWRQKGTGRARAGTIRSPMWRGGGVTFAARPQDHSQKVNRKMRQGALRCILSELARQDRLVVVDDFGVDTPKTRNLVAQLRELGIGDNVLIVTETVGENLYLASRNLVKVAACSVANADPVSLVAFDKVLITVGAVRRFEEILG